MRRNTVEKSPLSHNGGKVEKKSSKKKVVKFAKRPVHMESPKPPEHVEDGGDFVVVDEEKDQDGLWHDVAKRVFSLLKEKYFLPMLGEYPHSHLEDVLHHIVDVTENDKDTFFGISEIEKKVQKCDLCCDWRHVSKKVTVGKRTFTVGKHCANRILCTREAVGQACWSMCISEELLVSLDELLEMTAKHV
jgi:hypothetical protein